MPDDRSGRQSDLQVLVGEVGSEPIEIDRIPTAARLPFGVEQLRAIGSNPDRAEALRSFEDEFEPVAVGVVDIVGEVRQMVSWIVVISRISKTSHDPGELPKTRQMQREMVEPAIRAL